MSGATGENKCWFTSCTNTAHRYVPIQGARRFVCLKHAKTYGNSYESGPKKHQLTSYV